MSSHRVLGFVFVRRMQVCRLYGLISDFLYSTPLKIVSARFTRVEYIPVFRTRLCIISDVSI